MDKYSSTIYLDIHVVNELTHNSYMYMCICSFVRDDGDWQASNYMHTQNDGFTARDSKYPKIADYGHHGIQTLVYENWIGTIDSALTFINRTSTFL